MPEITSELWINAPLQKVYAAAQENERFPETMEDLSSLRVVERDGDRVVSEWVGVVSAFRLKIRWTQEDVWSDEAKTCTFRQISGDFDSMEGEWRFVEEEGKTLFSSTVRYEYSVPGLGQLAARVIQGLMSKNLDATLAAIGRAAEG